MRQSYLQRRLRSDPQPTVLSESGLLSLQADRGGYRHLATLTTLSKFKKFSYLTYKLTHTYIIHVFYLCKCYYMKAPACTTTACRTLIVTLSNSVFSPSSDGDSVFLSSSSFAKWGGVMESSLLVPASFPSSRSCSWYWPALRGTHVPV